MTEYQTPTEKLVNKPSELINKLVNTPSEMIKLVNTPSEMINERKVKARRVKKLYAIYDKAREAFLGVMEKANHRLALRDFEIMCKSKESLLYQAKEDFSLYYLGDIDEETGEMIPGKSKLAEASEYVKETINE